MMMMTFEVEGVGGYCAFDITSGMDVSLFVYMVMRRKINVKGHSNVNALLCEKHSGESGMPISR